MRTSLLAIACLLGITSAAKAEDSHQMEHGGQIFHMFVLETDAGLGHDDTIARWDFDGWIGSDENKLWLKSEGENADGKTESSEFWAMFSRNIDTFWDAQIGVRYDNEPSSTSYLVAGFIGLAPYFFDTEAHIFVSDDGDLSARIREENDFLITQRFILQPYLELHAFLQNVPEQQKGSGIANGEVGLQARYEITRNLAPYVDIRYERKFGNTASFASRSGEHSSDVISSLGMHLMF